MQNLGGERRPEFNNHAQINCNPGKKQFRYTEVNSWPSSAVGTIHPSTFVYKQTKQQNTLQQNWVSESSKAADASAHCQA